MVHPSPIDVSRRDTTTALSLLLTVTAASLLSGCAAFSPAASATSLSPFVAHNGAVDIALPFPPAGGRISTNVALVRPARGGVDVSSPRMDCTALSMGLRSFIRRKFLGRGEGGEDDGDGEEGEDDSVTLHSIMQSPDSFGLLESPRSVEEDDVVREVYGRRASDRQQQGEDEEEKATTTTPVRPPPNEDTQQRIRRMKGGGMTEEEKANFLNNALTGALPKTKPRGPPIRQKIPGVEGDEGDAGGRGDRGKESASDGGSRTSAKENLWNALTKKDFQKKDGGSKGGVKSKSNTDISVVSLMMDSKTKGEEAKRKYLASVTNPDRFATFSTYQKQQRANDEKDEVADVQDSTMMEEGAVEDGDGGPESAGVASGTDFMQMKRQIVEDRALLNADDTPDVNAARDAVESILSMIGSNNDKKAASSDQISKSTDNLAARLGQAAEEQEKRDAEARLAADKKKEEDRRRLAEIQMQREEEARRKEVERMEKARRIADEERRKREDKEFAERAELETRQALQDEYWAKKLEKERARKGTGEPIEIKKKTGVTARDERKIQEDNRASEKEIGDKILRDRERVLDIETIAAARVSRTVPKRVKEDVSKSSFVKEQQRKKEEIDRLRTLEMQSLKSLSTPIPSPSKGPPRAIPPTTYRAPPPAVVPTPVPAPVRAQAQPTPSAHPPPPPTKSLNLFEMTKLKQDPAASSQESSSARPAAKAEPPARRVVRQRVIRDDDVDDDDDENLMRSGAPGLTVADALKKQRKSGGGGGGPGGKTNISAEDKAKQWGIDMSRFK